MDPTEMAGWIGGVSGVVGALAGASASIWTTFLVQRKQAAQAKDERLEEQERTAVSDAMTELYQLRTIPNEWGSEDREEHRTYEAEADNRIQRIQLSLLLVRDPAARQRLETIAYVVSRWHRADTLRGQRRWIQSTAQFGLECLAVYARGEDEMPEPTDGAAMAFRMQIRHLQETRSPRMRERLAHLMAFVPDE
ncbi:hypothetical protein [Actinacidiphila oryziradicis]|uniref:Uncharacterized protein n=1 Tax=Actinacidiphila oryziradicis TaxID=2571141 RepID=A0A4U0RU22_9ACTN|nr:hypothetical protein [Actinacidiphila oryziradicis]TJZ98992.1 hypothetical protein FCI23_47355 [Actinacidiphila oryziradicis]